MHFNGIVCFNKWSEIIAIFVDARVLIESRKIDKTAAEQKTRNSHD